MNQAKWITCGAGLTFKQGDKTCVCAYCQTTNIVENALALGKVEVDVTEDIKFHRPVHGRCVTASGRSFTRR